MKIAIFITLLATAMVAVCNTLETENGMNLGYLTENRIEPAGANCEHGGWRVNSGFDSNGDAKLNPNESRNVQYQCLLVSQRPEPAGPHCAVAGFRTNTGLDTNANKVLEQNEVGEITYHCGVSPSDTVSEIAWRTANTSF